MLYIHEPPIRWPQGQTEYFERLVYAGGGALKTYGLPACGPWTSEELDANIAKHLYVNPSGSSTINRPCALKPPNPPQHRFFVGFARVFVRFYMAKRQSVVHRIRARGGEIAVYVLFSTADERLVHIPRST